MPRLLVLFLDGVGIGPADPAVNPFFRSHLPDLRQALGGSLPSLSKPEPQGPGGRAFPVDARLSTRGIPQSGTGQTTILTGANAAQLLGRHFGPWPPVRLRTLLEEKSFLRRAVAGGARVAFANAYPRGYPGNRDSRRVAAPPLAARAAGLMDRHQEALSRGTAVASEIVNDGWREVLGHGNLPEVTPRGAGVNLARLAAEADLTFFAHYGTDLAGHRGGMDGGIAALEQVDAFLGGILSELSENLSVLVVSDHGNIEDVRSGHTRNPAVGLSLGPLAAELPSPRSLTEIADLVVSTVLRGRD